MTVADHLSVTKAARSLHLTQQAVSHQIAMLESELDVSLFIRANRRIYLTAEGERVLEIARQQLEPLEDELLAIKADRRSLKGRIRIGCLPETASHFLIPLVSEFKKLHPGVVFEFKLNTDQLTEKELFQGEVDLGFVIFKTEVNHLQSRPFVEVPYTAVASPDFLRKFGPIKKFDQLATVPFVDYLPMGPAFLTWVKKNSRPIYNKVLHREPEVAAADERVMRELVLSGLGVGVLPTYVVQNDIKEGRLKKVLPKSKTASARFEAIALKNRKLPHAVQAFFDAATHS